MFLLYDGLYLGFAMGSPMSDFLLQTGLFHVAFLMSGRFYCCGGYCCYSLTASQKRSLMMMRWTEWIQLRFRKIPLSTQSQDTECYAMSWFPSWLILRCDYIATTAAITHRLGTFETSIFRVLFTVPTSQLRHY